jgi:hypothetical protein
MPPLPPPPAGDDLSAAPFLVTLTERPQPGVSLLLYLCKDSTTVVRAGGHPAPSEAQQFAMHGADNRDQHARFELDDAGTVTLHYQPPPAAEAGSSATATAAQADADAEPDLS